MDFSLSPEQQQIRDEVRKLCFQFDDAYWLDKDRSGEFPHELHAALAAAGWLGIAMPEEYGGARPRITQAAIIVEAIAGSRAALSGAPPGPTQNLRPQAGVRVGIQAPKCPNPPS